MTTTAPAVASVATAPALYEVRGALVVLDADAATLFGVATQRLTEQIRRNQDRFGSAFAFHLTREDWVGLKSQIAGSSGHGGRRKPP